MRSRVVALVTALALGGAAGAAFGAPPASAVQAQVAVVSERPTAGPQIVEGTVYAITQVGGTLFAGGSFAHVQSKTTTPYDRQGVVAWDTLAKAVSTTFHPQLTKTSAAGVVSVGTVRALLPGPVAGTVFVGGEFDRVDGVAAKALVLLRVSDGSRVAGFTLPPTDGVVDTLQLSGGQLYVGGTFTKLGGQLRGGLATLDPATGAVVAAGAGALASAVTGHHAWTPTSTKQVQAPVGVDRLAVSPDGTRLVGIGNFKNVDAQPRDQVAMWDLTTTPATLLGWHPPRYDALCSTAYDSDVRDVGFSPDGSYFVIVGTGGRKGGSLCDSAGRFETGVVSLTVEPTWISTSGADSLLSVAITGTTVYLGGHERWLNNPNGGDVPGPGAVPRPGLGALDPATGVPLAWNPGRNPRGAGTYALYASPDGLWAGSDTNYYGHAPTVKASKIAFFPPAGGRAPASKLAPALPATAVVGPTGGSTAFTARPFDGTSAGAGSSVSSPLDPASLRGVTLIGSTLFYGKTDGQLYERSVSGTGAYGPEAKVDPYNDPFWSPLKNGSGPPIAPAGQTYRGVLPSFYSDPARTTNPAGDLPSVTSMFYDPATSLLFYTLAGKTGLFSRAFSPDITRNPGGVTTGGVIFPNATTVSGVSLFGAVTGAFLTGGNLYYATTDGTLSRVAFSGGRPVGTPVPVGAGTVWSSRALYLLPGAATPPPPAPPTAAFTSTCDSLGCSFDSSGSSDTDGTITARSWDFGDGSSGSAVAPRHDYAVQGSYSVVLTVTDSQGLTGSVTHTVSTAGVTSSVAFRAAGTAVSTTGSSGQVGVPAAAQAGDALVLTLTTATGATASAPAGWSLVTSQANGTFLTAHVFTRTATAADPGATVAVPLSTSAKYVAQVLAYSGAASVSTLGSRAETALSTTHPAPGGTLAAAGSWMLTYWVDKSADTSTAGSDLQAPAGLTQRGRLRSAGTTFLTSVLADSGSGRPAGAVPGATATTAVASRADAVTLVLTPAA